MRQNEPGIKSMYYFWTLTCWGHGKPVRWLGVAGPMTGKYPEDGTATRSDNCIKIDPAAMKTG
jgi:hypothetical protein